jgi:hypothetical protein
MRFVHWGLGSFCVGDVKMTPQERQCINESLEAACINGASLEAAARSIGEQMLHLTAAEVAETCRVHAEELGVAAAYSAQAPASKRIAQTIKETEQPDFDSEPSPWRA